MSEPLPTTSRPPARPKKQVIEDIECIARQPGFINIFVLLCRRDLFLAPGEAADKNWRESLSYQELGLLAGLMVKHPLQNAYPDEETLDSQIDAIDRLFRELHDAYSTPMIESFKQAFADGPQPKQSPSLQNPPYGTGDYFAEGIFYDGSGAYDFQYLDLAAKRYEEDDPWMMKHRGFSVPTACAIARQLKSLIEGRMRRLTWPNSYEEACDQLLKAFCFEPGDITDLPTAEVAAFLESFSLEFGQANPAFEIYGDYNSFDALPILSLGDNRYFLPISFTLTQSIYESPFYWMSADPKYKDFSFDNRGKATAKLAYDMMVQVFGPARVFKDVRVMKNKSETVTDIDVLAFVGNKAVVLQAKSKKLTQLSRRGSEEKLRADFKAAIQDGYAQAVTCRHAILNRNHTFLDRDGNELVLEESLDEAYLICVTADNYPGLIHQVDHFLTRKPGEPPPIAISLFDLDVLTFYLKDPFDFVFYQRQRVATADYYIADNEVALLAYHLRRRLWRSPGADGEGVDASWAQLIDAHFPVARGSHPHTEVADRLLNRWKNDDFNRLMKQLKESRIPGFTDAVFMLYEMSSDSADGLMDQINKTKQKTARDGKRHSFSVGLGEKNDRGVSFVCRTDVEMLSEDMFALGASKKYQLRANEWLSLGSIHGSSNIVDAAMFSKQPWKEDPDMERLSRSLKAMPRMRVGEKVGRNDPCTCGSGRKFKKCCGLSSVNYFFPSTTIRIPVNC
jgi:hypothetical protein